MPNYLIITGASKGIGKSTATLFLQQEWKVINLSRHTCDLKGVINFAVDLSNPEWEEQSAAQLLKEIQNPEKICLIHNAAYYYKDSVNDIDTCALRKALEVAIVAPAMLNKLLVPRMPAGSSILYIGSTLSEKAVKNAASYVITKHAVAGMMKATCQDLAGTNIHTSCICPGFTDTEMLRSHLQNNAEVLVAVKSLNTMQRLIEPHEIAETLWFCANHPVINGSVLHANLGQVES